MSGYVLFPTANFIDVNPKAFNPAERLSCLPSSRDLAPPSAIALETWAGMGRTPRTSMWFSTPKRSVTIVTSWMAGSTRRPSEASID